MIIIQGSKAKYWLGIWASLFLGMTFIVAGMGKWFSGVVEFQLLTTQHTLTEFLNTWLLPIELTIGIILVAGIFTKCAASFSLLLIAGFIINNILLISVGLGGEPCNCFGMGNTLSVIDSLFLDGVMVALAITILVLYPGRFFNKRPWYWG